MAAMEENSPPLATSSDISAKSQAVQPSHIVPTAMRNSPGPRRGTVTWSMANAKQGETREEDHNFTWQAF